MSAGTVWVTLIPERKLFGASENTVAAAPAPGWKIVNPDWQHLQPIGMQTVPLMNAVESPIHVELSPSTSHDSGGLALPPTLHSGTWGKQATILLLGVLLVTSATIVRGIHVGEFSYNVDETQ